MLPAAAVAAAVAPAMSVDFPGASTRSQLAGNAWLDARGGESQQLALLSLALPLPLPLPLPVARQGRCPWLHSKDFLALAATTATCIKVSMGRGLSVEVQGGVNGLLGRWKDLLGLPPPQCHAWVVWTRVAMLIARNQLVVDVTAIPQRSQPGTPYCQAPLRPPNNAQQKHSQLWWRWRRSPGRFWGTIR